tara:strand:+ start:732 stop:1196 length:465 start_codon:yes stop_codon:yes gene_type:complete
MPPSFDRFIEKMKAPACPEWKAALDEMCSLPTVMMTLRWHYETSMLVRQAFNAYLSTITKCTSSGWDPQNMESAYNFARDLLGQFSTYEERAKGTEVHEAAVGSSEVLANDRVLQAVCIILSTNQELERVARAALATCAGRFNAKRFIVIVKNN